MLEKQRMVLIKIVYLSHFIILQLKFHSINVQSVNPAYIFQVLHNLFVPFSISAFVLSTKFHNISYNWLQYHCDLPR